MFNTANKIHVFRKFLLSYVLILVIPLIASFLIYQMSVEKMKDNATENSKKLLNQTVSIIDRKNDELEKLVYQISLNPAINQLMYRKLEDKNIGYDLYQVRQSLIPYWYTNNIVSHFYIYFNNIDMIVSPESSYIRIKDYFDSHIYNDLTFEEWNKNINQTYYTRKYFPSAKVRMGEKSESFITLVQSIPFSRTAAPNANIVVMINEKEITSLLNRISSQYDGATFVYDEDGNIIVNDQMDVSLISFDKAKGTYSINNHNKDLMYIESKSTVNNWTYVAVISKHKLLEDIKHIQRMNFWIALVTVIVGLGIAMLFSYRNSIPLNRLLGIMHVAENNNIKNPYDFLHNNVAEMISRNDHLKEQMQNQLPILQDTILRKLVMGEITSQQEAMLLIEQARLPIKGKLGYVCVVQIIHMIKTMDKEILDEMNIAQLFIQNELEALFKEDAISFQFAADEVVFLLTCEQELSIQEEKGVEEKLRSLIKCLEDTHSLKVNIGMGRLFKQLDDISQSFEEAKLSLPFIQSVNDGPAFYKYKDYHSNKNMDYYYPIELELRLINVIRNGDVKEVKELLDKIYVENVEQRVLTQQVGEQLLSSLNGTILRVLAKNRQLSHMLVDEISKKMEEMMMRKSAFQKDFEQIQSFIMDITQNIHEKKSVSGQLIIHKMKEYIKENFHNPDLTLYKISDAINIPETMVPAIFKEHVGLNISDFIEDVRINFAKAKLTETDDSIESIALESGYNSAHSFRRAFKRNTGSSPSEYRKMMNRANKQL